jgi:hypothetical protein
MKTIPKLLLMLALGGFTTPGLFAQEGILSASCDASGIGGTVSWSVGQVAYSAWSDATGFVTEGVQQPYEIFNITGFEESASAPRFIVFPNPTSGKVTLKIFDPGLENFDACIYDMNGKRLLSVKVGAEEATIPMEDLRPATYVLNILEKDQTVMTYKIIKK